jgi:uncharacterized membrane protein (UPF0127 family)
MLADTSAERRRGLSRLDAMGESSGLWMVPCEAIHTFFMKFAIDALFLDKTLRVTNMKSHLRPFRIAGSLRAFSVLELPAGTIVRSRTRIGHQLRCSPGLER